MNKFRWLSLLLISAMLLSLSVICNASEAETPITWESLIRLDTISQLEYALGGTYHYEINPVNFTLTATSGTIVAFTAATKDGIHLSGAVTVHIGSIPLTENLNLSMPYSQLLAAGRNSGFSVQELSLGSNNGISSFVLILEREDLRIRLPFHVQEGHSLNNALATQSELYRLSSTPHALPFLDVSPGAWYANAVRYVYTHGLMSGVSSDLFLPDSTTTRAMIVTILYNLEDQPAASHSRFKDVPNHEWYADPIAWAARHNIVTGYDKYHFYPNDPITREQLAVILYRYSAYRHYNTRQRADLSGFIDSDSISSYALKAVRWANAASLINGATASILAPQRNASRAQTATIFMRFLEDVAS